MGRAERFSLCKGRETSGRPGGGPPDFLHRFRGNYSPGSVRRWHRNDMGSRNIRASEQGTHQRISRRKASFHFIWDKAEGRMVFGAATRREAMALDQGG